MRTEDEQWDQFRRRGAQMIAHGFADRVMREARRIESAPLVVKQLALCATTAALCLAAVIAYQRASGDNALSNDGWRDVSSQMSDYSDAL
jgi:hypothetical protein